MSLRHAASAMSFVALAGAWAAIAPDVAAAQSPATELQQAIHAWQQAPYRQTQFLAEASLSVIWQAAYARSSAWSSLADRLSRDGRLALFHAEDDVWQVSGSPAEMFTASGVTGAASLLWFRGEGYERTPNGWAKFAEPQVVWNPMLGAWRSARETGGGAAGDEIEAVMDAGSAKSMFGPWLVGVVGTALFGGRGVSAADLKALLAHTTVYGHFAISRASGAPQLNAATVTAVVAVPATVVAEALGQRAASAVNSMTWRIDWTMKTRYERVPQTLPQGFHPGGWPAPEPGNSTGNSLSGENDANTANGSAGGTLENGT
ncbi:hypothetical protein [Alicyclobacillus fructus]|uniref:hypothetical protein n=1 Tax=Alicyclobacillus fructus TaxID=2816082 RepID=UPI001A8DD69D|nr:hypothetical protein [Alicyclobacillus fructus]